MRSLRFILLILTSNALLTAETCMAEQTVTDGECDRRWSELLQSHRDKIDYASILSKWKTQEMDCKGTGSYEINLASIYLELEEFDKAHNALRSAPIPERLKQRAEFVDINVEYLFLLSKQSQLERKELERLDSRIVAFENAYPTELKTFGILGHIRVVQGKYSEAIAPLRKITTSSIGGDLLDFRNLTIAYARSGQYDAALEMLDKTYAMSKSISSDEEFMYAAILSYAAVDRLDAAKMALTLILSKKPHLQDDPRFRETVLIAKELSRGKLK